MKLNWKRTLLVSSGFLTIMMLWQVYNWFMPLFLNDFLEGLFKGDKLVVGIVMALDNLFALFMIPLMGRLSDRTHTKLGKRIPFIIVGMILSAVTFVLLPIINKLGLIWLLLINILAVLISMNIYRSPCVALMPDITPRPLRNRGNSLSNIMGGAGVVIGYGLIFIFYDKTNLTSFKNYIPFIAVSVIMIVVMIINVIFVKENKFVQDYKDQCKEYGLDYEEDKKEEKEVGKAAKTNRKVVFLSLLVVFFVYMANNAVETWLSLFASQVFDSSATFLGISVDSLPLIFFGVGTFAASIPAALVADKIGRRNTILLGASVLGICYLTVGLMTIFKGYSMGILPAFLIGGAGFSFVTINIYPLVVENCSDDQIGTFTGKYYSASMLAQTITPALSGLFLSNLVFNNMLPLFPYCVIFMILTVVVLLFIKNDKPVKEKKVIENEK